MATKKKRGSEMELESAETESSQEPIFDLIRADHRMVEDLFEQIEAADEDAAGTLIEQVVHELLLHMRAEEETFYARLREEEEFREDILKADEEHQIVHQLCRDLLSGKDMVDDRRLAKAKVLKELVQHHVEEATLDVEGGKHADVARAMEMGQPSR
jgi:hypothetical protein